MNVFQIVSIVTAIAGMAIFLCSLVSLNRACRSRFWATVRGEVINAKVTRYTSKDWWDWQFRYQYIVNGCKYEGTRAYFGGKPTLALARNIVAKFPTKAPVNVYYQENKPSLCVLLPGPNRYTYFALLSGPFFWGIAMLSWVIPYH
jgi:hypothetical protein